MVVRLTVLTTLILLTACSDGSGSRQALSESAPPDGENITRPPGSDISAPNVVKTVPADGSYLAQDNAEIQVRFDEPIDPASIRADTMVVDGPGDRVDGVMTAEHDALLFSVSEPLAAGTSYTATVAPGVSDLRGNASTRAHSWRFETFHDSCPTESIQSLQLISGRHRAESVPEIPQPPKAAYYADPVYGACVTRLTDHDNEPPVGFARNDYSRRRAFNADGSLVLIYARDGYWHLYDAHTLDHVRRLNLGGGSVEPQWHPTNRDTLFVLPNNGGLEINEFNVRTDRVEQTVSLNLPIPIQLPGEPPPPPDLPIEDLPIGDLPIDEVSDEAGDTSVVNLQSLWPQAARLWTRSEGSPSMNGRYWALLVETADFKPLGLVTFDLERQKILGYYDFQLHGNGIGRPDHVSMSPTGNYVVVSWNGPGVDCPSTMSLGTLTEPCGLMAFAKDFSTVTPLAARGPHSDMAVDAQGNEVIVISNYNSGKVEMISLATGALTELWDIYIGGAATAMHISGKNYNKPGWVLISTYGLRDPNRALPWYKNKLMAVELARNPRIINIANIYNRADSYFSEPHAVVNDDFTRILFNANWGSGRDEDIDAYLVILPAGVIPDA